MVFGKDRLTFPIFMVVYSDQCKTFLYFVLREPLFYYNEKHIFTSVPTLEAPFFDTVNFTKCLSFIKVKTRFFFLLFRIFQQNILLNLMKLHFYPSISFPSHWLNSTFLYFYILKFKFYYTKITILNIS